MNSKHFQHHRFISLETTNTSFRKHSTNQDNLFANIFKFIRIHNSNTYDVNFQFNGGYVAFFTIDQNISPPSENIFVCDRNDQRILSLRRCPGKDNSRVGVSF
jgi:hypothetical protein